MQTSGFFRGALGIEEQQVLRQLSAEAHQLHQHNSSRPVSIRKPTQLNPGPGLTHQPSESSLKSRLAQTRHSQGTVSLEQRAREQFGLLFKS